MFPEQLMRRKITLRLQQPSKKSYDNQIKIKVTNLIQSIMSYSDPQIGESLAVQITSKNPQYGLFVSTPNGISGLIRKLNISWSYQNRFYDSLHVGDYIQAIVTKVHPDGKIELSRKDACANPRDLNLDLILKGCVDSVENYGILIRFDGFIGLAPWVELTSTYYKAGDEITCVVKILQLKKMEW